MGFYDTPIDTEQVDQKLLDIDERTRTSLFAWNGQFSPQFIEAMLRVYGCTGWVTYDPFAGSGTVVEESLRVGMGAIASELNPAPYHMAKIRSFAGINREERMALCDDVSEQISHVDEDDVPGQLQRIHQKADGAKKDAIALLIVLCDFYKNNPSKKLIESKWNHILEIINNLVETDQLIDVKRADARHVPFADGEADLVLTSPPYINVMNYHQQYRRSVELLGYPVLEIARSEFGANRLNRGNRFLTVIEYTVDMGLAMRETSRVAKGNAQLIFVVGKESRVLGCPFCNSEIVWRVATEVLGMHGKLRQQRKFKNRFGKVITEDILHFYNTDCRSLTDDNVIALCQKIARDALKHALETNELTEDRNALLKAAIDRYETVRGC